MNHMPIDIERWKKGEYPCQKEFQGSFQVAVLLELARLYATTQLIALKAKTKQALAIC